MQISDRIFQLLKEKNMRQTRFAKLTNISPSTISDWKTKHLNPSADKLPVIARVLEISLEELLTGEPGGEEQFSVYKGSEEYHLIEIYRGLEDEQKNRLWGYLEALSGK